MNEATLSSFVLILVVVALAPVLSDWLERWVRVPNVVLEILAGVLIGPALGWADVDDVIEFFAQLGLALLMFLAGLEIDLARVRGRPLQRAAVGWVGSLVIGIALGVSLRSIDGPRSGLIVGLAITTTALGTLLPILRDSGEARTPFGTNVLAGAAVGELGPILAITILLGSDRPARTVVVLTLFVVVVIVTVALAMRERNARLARLLEGTLTTSAQLAVRLVVLFLAFMVWTAEELGLDILLGAFAAGMVTRLFGAASSQREVELVEAKLQAIGFGFFIPVFFVVSGMQFDLDSVLDDPYILLTVPLILVAFLVVRGLPTALLQKGMPVQDRVALACYLATALPLVVVITTIGVQTDRLNSATAAALVTSGMVSVLVFPLAARRARGDPASDAPGSRSAGAGLRRSSGSPPPDGV